jgi:glc operon protein GlcG
VELTLGLALEAAAAAEARAVSLGIDVVVCIVDEGGNNVLFHRMDGAQLASSVIASAKAYTALAWRRPSADLMPIAQAGAKGFAINTLDARFTLSRGGLPIVFDGRVAGGIGVSGGPSEQDEECARAGLEAIGAV